MNRARQDAITTEIMEIVGGAEALRQAARATADDLLVDRIELARDLLRRPRTDRYGPQEHDMTITEPHPRRPRSCKDGRVVAIAGPVVDVEFPPDALPEINTAARDDDRARGRRRSTITGRGRPADRRQPGAGHLPEAHRRPAPRHRRCATPATASRCRSATACSATCST